MVRFIKNNQPETVCLFGHSRGAVLATMIAARLHEAAPTVTGAKLWLLDLVGKTDIGMSPYLDDSVTRTAYPNVSDIVRIVMEDEPSTVMFPLQSFSVQRAGAPPGSSTTCTPDRSTGHGSNRCDSPARTAREPRSTR